MFLLHSLQMINILRQMEKCIVNFLTRVSYNMINQSVGYCRVTATKIMDPFSLLMNPSLFRVFFLEKTSNIDFISYFLFITKSFSLATSAKTTF